MTLREYTFLGTTQSLCPDCLALVPAKIVRRGSRVYFRKRCPTHGEREDFVCSDASQYDRTEFAVPARVPKFGVEPDRGCPFDCGLCTEHEQHTCIGLVEITESCNLTCPMCYAASGPGGRHLSVEECRRAIDRLVEVEGRPEVLQLSGGEPTIHPQFGEILDYALSQPIDYVMVNTNGIRLAHDEELLARLGEHRNRVEIYFQLDSLRDEATQMLRGEPLVQIKRRAIENLGRYDLNATLVATLQPGINDGEVGDLVRFALSHPWITGLSFQPATYSGRHFLPEELESRITFPDVIRAVAEQTEGLFREDDFLPLPCAHPNCHSLAYAYRCDQRAVPLTRFIDARSHFDLLANGISFQRTAVRDLIEQLLGRLGCCSGGSCTPESISFESSASRAGALPGQKLSRGLNVLEATAVGPSAPQEGGWATDLNLATLAKNCDPHLRPLAAEFFSRALSQDLSARDVLRITITSFLDAYNFDVRRVMKCCTHHVLPTGHVIPFCAYNILYRQGHVPLPPLQGC